MNYENLFKKFKTNWENWIDENANDKKMSNKIKTYKNLFKTFQTLFQYHRMKYSSLKKITHTKMHHYYHQYIESNQVKWAKKKTKNEK